MLFYYGFKLLVRIVFPLLIKRFIRKSHEKFNQRYQNPNEKEENSKSEDLNTDNSGEYVDFEELE